MKKLGIACIGLCVACMAVALTLYLAWSSFQPIAIVNSTIESEEGDLRKVSETWFEDFFKQYEGIFVPFDYRIVDKEIDAIEILDLAASFVQIDYRIKPASKNLLSQSYYSAIEEGGYYKVQIVVQFEKNGKGYIVKDKMSPVQYQIQTDSTLRDPQTQHYAMNDKDETYLFDKQKLYVTYNHGVSKIEVPIAYEDIAGTNNSLYSEELPAYGYMVSNEFTAFIAYDSQGCYMMYSEDQGSTWKTSRIYGNRYHGESVYLSKTNTGCYVSIAVDRSLGHEYYSTFKTSDFETWSVLDGEALSDKKTVVFFDSNVGYAAAGMTQDKQAIVNYTNDDGKSYQELIIPKQEVSFLDTSITPFVQMETMYKENGKLYMVVGQGQDGDYMKNNHFMKGLYVSHDGITFTFEKEIEDMGMILAG